MMRRALKVSGFVVACALALVLAGSVWYVVSFYPRKAESYEINTPELSQRVLIATQGSDFKNGLVTELGMRLQEWPAYIKVIDVSGLDLVELEPWRKIIIINTAMMNKLDGHVREFLARTPDRENILLLVTSGGGDYKPADLVVDAVSGASRMTETDRLAGLIIDWMKKEGNLARDPDDHVLALEYFLQVDVGAACFAVRAGGEHYRALYPDLEGRLNRIGYDFVQRELPDNALLVFSLNKDLFPRSWNVYDSYAEILQAAGQSEAAIANYRKSLELNPENEHGKQALEKLETGS